MSNRVCRRIVYAAAVLCHGCDDNAAWNCYLKWTQACWSGNVKSVIPELLAWLQSRGLDPAATLDEKHPDKAVHDGHRYLTNNASRMDYARYRRAGLPVTSAPMESLVKQVNLRVQGTEMFWNDANRGGESILQIKAAGLCDDSRLETYLRNRPGSPFVRKSPLSPPQFPKADLHPSRLADSKASPTRSVPSREWPMATAIMNTSSPNSMLSISPSSRSSDNL